MFPPNRRLWEVNEVSFERVIGRSEAVGDQERRLFRRKLLSGQSGRSRTPKVSCPRVTGLGKGRAPSNRRTIPPLKSGNVQLQRRAAPPCHLAKASEEFLYIWIPG
jgi:hypothetical protein